MRSNIDLQRPPTAPKNGQATDTADADGQHNPFWSATLIAASMIALVVYLTAPERRLVLEHVWRWLNNWLH